VGTSAAEVHVVFIFRVVTYPEDELVRFSNIHYIQGVPGGMCQTLGECSL